jgi:cytochrome c553
MTRCSTIMLLIAVLAPALCPADAGAGATVDYYESIKPLLAARCYKCHGAETQKSWTAARCGGIGHDGEVNRKSRRSCRE